MINVVIKNEGYAPLWLELPRNRMLFANKLREIGINIPPSELKCNLNKDGISVKLWGNSDFEKKLVSVLHDRYISSVNKIVETLLFMPWEEKQKFEKDVLTNRLKSYADILDRLRLCQDIETIEKFYFPLTVRMCEYDENGYFDESSENEYDGRFAARFEREIVDGFNRYTQHDKCNMVEYFDGSNGAQSKLKSMDWGFEEYDGELFGVVKVELTEQLTESEKAEVIDFISGQNSDGLGEGYEQQEIKTDDGEIYVSFWNHDDDYFIYDGKEFTDYLTHRNDMKLGGMNN